MKLPCRHIFAVLKSQELDIFVPEVVDHRWTREYYYCTQPTTPRRNSITVQQTPKIRVLSHNDKYRKSMMLFQKFASHLAQCGTEQFKYQYSKCKELFSAFKEGKNMSLCEVVTTMDATEDDLPGENTNDITEETNTSIASLPDLPTEIPVTTTPVQIYRIYHVTITTTT